jgi:hypothetical protein
MGTTQTTGPGTATPAGAGGMIMKGDIVKRESLGGDQVRVTLKNGEVLEGTALPDGRVIRGAGTSRPNDGT